MPALDGVRIADFTTMVNGSFTTRLLADMGADVIKIEAPDGDPWRNWAIAFLAWLDSHSNNTVHHFLNLPSKFSLVDDTCSTQESGSTLPVPIPSASQE